MTTSSARPPDRPERLSAWFAEAVRSEIAELEKSGGAQTYEVLSGKQFEVLGPAKAIYHFIIADATRVPEDASGKLKTASQQFTVSVVAQEANRISLIVEGSNLPKNIPRAVLLVDDTALLKKLADALDKVVTNPTSVGPLATVIFHPSHATVGVGHTSNPKILAAVGEEKNRIISQVCGSSLTYVWGPPGTGKTHLIAYLIAALIQVGERLLVTSHTNVAVDQALYAAIKKESEPGPLADSPLLQLGKILRIGQTADPKIPAAVRLDKVLDSRTQELQVKILELETKVHELSEQAKSNRLQLSKWDRLEKVTQEMNAALDEVNGAEDWQKAKESATAQAKRSYWQSRQELEQAEHAWFFRKSKVQRATLAVKTAEKDVRDAEESAAKAIQAVETARAWVENLDSSLAECRTACEGLPRSSELETQIGIIEAQISPLQDEISRLNDQISELQRTIIRDAQIIFCTLTKNYVGKELEGQAFDAVIADETSMALPPMLFLAGGRAKARVVLVGDFLQLPPIIRSDVPVTNQRLGTDAFQLSGVARGMKPDKDAAVLTGLTEQRRMAPRIADVARHLVYNRAGFRLTDHAYVNGRPVPQWLDFLPENPLTIVDTADLHCWCGKQPGTLSRFNFYSATIAAELAAIAATRLPEPSEEIPPPIGIVTPYAAQRRLLGRLVEGMNLAKWVTAGTVHTFQGSQAALIVFDSVLDEPHWSARLCTPDAVEDVLRQINVAVTRAQHKFVFVGSSEWLNQYAKPASGLGQLWSYLKAKADLVSASDLVGTDYPKRAVGLAGDDDGWRVPVAAKGDGPVHEIFDETTFFEKFKADLGSAKESIFGLVPYFGEFRWPTVEPIFRKALSKEVEVTLVTPPLSEVERNRDYVEKAIKNLRDLGAIVIASSGLHGKDVVIDAHIHYTGSLNWASHRGRAEIMHRTDHPALARLVLEFLQAKYIRAAVVHEDRQPRTCPECGGPVHVVNQRVQGRFDRRQALKVGCVDYKNTGCKYLRDIDERAPFREPPRCKVDGRTKYRRVRRGRGEIWQCPKHPKECPRERVIPGDP